MARDHLCYEYYLTVVQDVSDTLQNTRLKEIMFNRAAFFSHPCSSSSYSQIFIAAGFRHVPFNPHGGAGRSDDGLAISVPADLSQIFARYVGALWKHAIGLCQHFDLAGQAVCRGLRSCS